MWEYYLCYCEAGFEERQINTVQVMFAKPACTVDPVTQLGKIGAAQQRPSSDAIAPTKTRSRELGQGTETCQPRSF